MVTLFLVTTLLVTLAQTGSIKGIIVDGATGEPLIGASVLVEGTTQLRPTWMVLDQRPGPSRKLFAACHLHRLSPPCNHRGEG